MKRYQCIKNWYYLSDDSDDNLLFKMGNCYPETNEEPYLPGNVVVMCEDGHGIQVTPDVLKTYFQELLDLNVDDDPDRQYESPISIPSSSAERGCAWIVVGVITVCALVYLAITWRS